jgi:hypothetical protein
MQRVTERVALDMYDEILSDIYGTVEVCGMTMDAVTVLKEMDETAYREGFWDYVNNAGEDGIFELIED